MSIPIQTEDPEVFLTFEYKRVGSTLPDLIGSKRAGVSIPVLDWLRHIGRQFTVSICPEDSASWIVRPLDGKTSYKLTWAGAVQSAILLNQLRQVMKEGPAA